jgi:hypothetical protein
MPQIKARLRTCLQDMEACDANREEILIESLGLRPIPEYVGINEQIMNKLISILERDEFLNRYYIYSLLRSLPKEFGLNTIILEGLMKVCDGNTRRIVLKRQRVVPEFPRRILTQIQRDDVQQRLEARKTIDYSPDVLATRLARQRTEGDNPRGEEQSQAPVTPNQGLGINIGELLRGRERLRTEGDNPRGEEQPQAPVTPNQGLGINMSQILGRRAGLRIADVNSRGAATVNMDPELQAVLRRRMLIS